MYLLLKLWSTDISRASLICFLFITWMNISNSAWDRPFPWILYWEETISRYRDHGLRRDHISYIHYILHDTYPTLRNASFCSVLFCSSLFYSIDVVLSHMSPGLRRQCFDGYEIMKLYALMAAYSPILLNYWQDAGVS